MIEISDTRSMFASEDARPWPDEKKIAFDRKYTAALMEFVNGRRYAAVNPSDREEWFSAWRARAISRASTSTLESEPGASRDSWAAVSPARFISN